MVDDGPCSSLPFGRGFSAGIGVREVYFPYVEGMHVLALALSVGIDRVTAVLTLVLLFSVGVAGRWIAFF